MQNERLNWSGLAYSLLFLFAVVAGFTFLEYGPSWDEHLSRTNGFLTFLWYDTAGNDTSALRTMDLYLYGALFDFVSYVASVYSPLDPFQTNHLLILCISLFGLWGVFLLGRLVCDARAGFLAALILVLTPTYYGHSFMNPKDIPFAVGYLWALYFLCHYLRDLPRPGWFNVLGLGVFAGLTMGVRVGGILLLGYFALFGILWWFRNRHYLRMGESKRYLAHAVFVLAIAWGLMLVAWPYGQVDPFINPFKALLGNTHFVFDTEVLFKGAYLKASQLPWDYLPVWFSIRLPEVYFFALLLGGIAIFRATLPSRKKVFLTSLLIFSVLVPPLLAIVMKSTLYDGLRHFIFVLPPLAVLAGVSLSAFIETLQVPATAAVYSVTAALLALVAYDMSQLHPYEYIYFNRLVAGGIEKSGSKFDLDYWATTSKEGTEWLLSQYKPDTPDPIRLSTCTDGHQIKHLLEKDPKNAKRFVLTHEDPHVKLTLQRHGCHTKTAGRVLHSITRGGVPLMHIKEVRPPEMEPTQLADLGLQPPAPFSID